MSTENEIETGARLALSAVQAASVIQLPDARIFAVRPTGPGAAVLENLTQPHKLAPPIPTYVKQEVTVSDEASLIVYLNRFKNADSVLFGNIDADEIKGVIDYHEQPADESVPPAPQLSAHNVLLDLPFSEEWRAWTGVDGEMMRQIDFVRFIEDNALDIVDPSGADLIEICRDMQGLKKASFTNVVRVESGNAEKFEYSDESRVNSKGDVVIPTQFTLRLPVYFNGDDYTLIARLRYQIEENGGLRLGVKLLRAEKLRQTAFREIVERVRDATGLTTLYGINA